MQSVAEAAAFRPAVEQPAAKPVSQPPKSRGPVAQEAIFNDDTFAVSLDDSEAAIPKPMKPGDELEFDGERVNPDTLEVISIDTFVVSTSTPAGKETLDLDALDDVGDIEIDLVDLGDDLPARTLAPSSKPLPAAADDVDIDIVDLDIPATARSAASPAAAGGEDVIDLFAVDDIPDLELPKPAKSAVPAKPAPAKTAGSADDFSSIDVDDLGDIDLGDMDPGPASTPAPKAAAPQKPATEFDLDMAAPETVAPKAAGKAVAPKNAAAGDDLDLGDIDLETMDLDLGDLDSVAAPAGSRPASGDSEPIPVDIDQLDADDDDDEIVDIDLSDVLGKKPQPAGPLWPNAPKAAPPPPPPAREPETVVESANDGEEYNVFLSKINDLDKREQVIDMLVDTMGYTAEKAADLVEKVVVPIAKGISKKQADAVMEELRKLNVVGRATKRRK